MTDRKDQYHDNPHHYSNWCRVCGCYYCWHKEAPHNPIYDCAKKHHKFEPMQHENDFPMKKSEVDTLQSKIRDANVCHGFRKREAGDDE